MKKILFIIIIFLFSFSYSNALIKVDITRGNLDPLPIAVSPLHVDESSDKSQQIDIKKLGIKKYRNLHSHFIVEGDKVFKDFLDSNIPIFKSYSIK